MSDDIPFSTFVGYLKSMRPGSFEETAREAIAHAFPGFLRAPRSGQISAVRYHRSSRLERADVMAPYLFRRFAGESSLPRGRYYSVADDSYGNDMRTLLHELLAYYETGGVSGPMIAFDGRDEEHRSNFISRFAVSKEHVDKSAIILAFVDPYAPEDFSTTRQSSALESIPRPLSIVPLPYDVIEVTIDDVIDLRLASTRRWLEERVSHELPGCLFSYGGRTASGLFFKEARPCKPERVFRRIEGVEIAHWKTSEIDRTSDTLVWRPRGDWDGEAAGTLVDDASLHLSLLPFLLFAGNGGSPITEVIGIWLRRLGAAGLVYPSARHDFGVVLRDGQLVSSGGWNFVDYQGLAPPAEISWRIEEPDSWSSEVDLGELDHALNPRYAGSWRLMDRGQLTMDRFAADQRSLGERILSAEEHEQQDLRVRGKSMRPEAVTAEDQLVRLYARYKEGNYKICAECLRALIESEGLHESVEPKQRAYSAFFMLGLAEAKLARHEEAIDAFEKAFTIAPDRSEPLANIGNSCLAMNQFDRALDAYRAALSIDPTDKVAVANIDVVPILKSAAERGGR